MKRRTEITIETERVVVMARTVRKNRLHCCNNCDGCVDMLSIDNAAIAAQVSSRTIFRWVEAGMVHSSETPEGLLLICPKSLPVLTDGCH